MMSDNGTKSWSNDRVTKLEKCVQDMNKLLQAMTAQNAQFTKKKRGCFLCGEMGHFKWNCPKEGEKKRPEAKNVNQKNS